MSWIENCIWWHVYPLGFTGAPVRPLPGEGVLIPRIDQLLPWLDYALDLGVNGLALGPVFESTSHGYDSVDYYNIDPRLGDQSCFDRFVSACRDRGIAVMLDGVFNHVGIEHPLFQHAISGGASASLFHIDRSGGSLQYADFEGHKGLAKLNHDSAEVVKSVSDIMAYWLRRGVSAWRLDAAYAVPSGFWAQVLPVVRREFPEAWFVGEVIHGDYTEIVRNSGMDSLTQYELWKAIWSSLLDGNFFDLDWCLVRHNDFLKTFTPMTFVGNHDVTRLASKVGDAKAALAVVILFSVGGTPSIYYGDEQAFRGVKTEGIGGDDEVRPAFPGSPSQLSPLGTWMYRLHQDLISIRRCNPWLVHAVTEKLHLDNRSYAYDAIGRSGERLHVNLVLDPSPRAEINIDGQCVLHVKV